MPEPPEFPVPADDLRFLVRSERSRSPPRAAPARDPPARSPASAAAGQLLGLYMRRGRPVLERRESQQWELKRRVAVVCFVPAVSLIPLELIYFITCRPDLSGRRVRAKLITPRDVLRVLVLRSAPATTLLNRLRM